MLGYFYGWQGRDHTWCPEAGFARTYTAFRDFNWVDENSIDGLIVLMDDDNIIALSSGVDRNELTRLVYFRFHSDSCSTSSCSPQYMLND
jgi:hypothetical protein